MVRSRMLRNLSIPYASLGFESGVERIAQAVAQHVQGKDGQHDGQAGEGQHPPVVADILAGGGEHRAPLGYGRLHAEADEAEAGGVEDGVANAERRLHDDRGDAVGQDVRDDDAQVARAGGAGRFDIFLLLHRQYGCADDTRELRNGNTVVTYERDTIQGATYDLPNSFGFGVSYMKINKLLLAADFLYENWGDASYQGATDAFQNRTRLAIGAEYLPEYRGRNYFQAIRYRAGFHYGDSYIKVSPENGGKGSGYKEYGASIGLGFPMLDNRSMVNVAFEYVKVKPGEAFMIDEQYFRVTLNYTFNERWFFKFKLN